jgi:hypothetical protein
MPIPPPRQINQSTRGDDYVAVAERVELRWVKELDGKSFEIKIKVLGPDESQGEDRDIAILGRIVEWHKEGVAYEANPRHAEK